MQTAEADWTLSTTHAVAGILAALGGLVTGAAAMLWRLALRERGIDARFDAVEKDVAAVKLDAGAVKSDVAILRDRVGTLATRDDMREQFALVLTQLGNIQTRVDRLHDRRAED